MAVEKRGAWRVELAISGTAKLVGTDGTEIKRKISTRNVSVGGAYLTTDADSSVGNQIVISLEDWPYVGKEPVISFLGTIVRVERLSDGTYGIAVRFEEGPFFKGH